VDIPYLYSLMDLLGAEALDPAFLKEIGTLRRAGAEDGETWLRMLNRLRHGLLRELGAEPAEWDHLRGQQLDPGERSVFPIGVYLEEIRSPYNVGAVFRAAEAFGVETILLSLLTPSPLHPRARKTARGSVEVLSWRYEELSCLEKAESVFALELGGTPLDQFIFPSSGFMLVGSEELGLSPQALRIADGRGGRVTIPMGGAKRSLNVSVACGIALQAWFAQQSQLN
jgi:TrmH family RNA methyltransferase